jgi:hypothetical protein
MSKALVWLTVVAGLSGLQPRVVAAQTPGSVELGVLGAGDLGRSAEPAAGVAMVLNLSPGLAFNPSVLHFFHRDGTNWQIGGTFRYAPPVPVRPFTLYLGAGAAWTWTTLANNGRSNVVWLGQVGLDLPASRVMPFVEVQLLKYDTVNSQLVAGVRFALGER